MTTLIILGNPNQHTFANSIVAANQKSKELFGKYLTNVQVIHSENSYEKLRTERDWINHLKTNGVNDELFVERKIEINSDIESIDKFVHHLESIIKGVSDSRFLMIDLTNGTSFQKNVLSIAAYILDIQNQFVIDTAKLFEITPNKGFLECELLNQCYIPAPLNTNLDKLAYLNLSEITRYKQKIEKNTESFFAIDNNLADKKFFKENLLRSIELKMLGDLTNDSALYRIASASIVASFEELVNLILFLHTDKSTKGITLGPKLDLITDIIRSLSPPNFDLEFHQILNKLFLYIRNKATHKDQILTEIERFKTELSVKLSLLLIEFYIDIVFPILKANPQDGKNEKLKRFSSSELVRRCETGEVFYYGLDGDDTGLALETSFLSANDEKIIQNLSNSIRQATNRIEDFVKKRNGKVIFKAGDDILFKGSFDESQLREMQKIYEENTDDLTCSVGYGVSLQDVFLALKFAKAQRNKSSIVGLEIFENPVEINET